MRAYGISMMVLVVLAGSAAAQPAPQDVQRGPGPSPGEVHTQTPLFGTYTFVQPGPLRPATDPQQAQETLACPVIVVQGPPPVSAPPAAPSIPPQPYPLAQPMAVGPIYDFPVAPPMYRIQPIVPVRPYPEPMTYGPLGPPVPAVGPVGPQYPIARPFFSPSPLPYGYVGISPLFGQPTTIIINQ